MILILERARLLELLLGGDVRFLISQNQHAYGEVA